MFPPLPTRALIGGEIEKLAACVDHTSDRWGNGGMVYWKASDLVLLATWDQMVIFIDGRDPMEKK